MKNEFERDILEDIKDEVYHCLSSRCEYIAFNEHEISGLYKNDEGQKVKFELKIKRNEKL